MGKGDAWGAEAGEEASVQGASPALALLPAAEWRRAGSQGALEEIPVRLPGRPPAPATRRLVLVCRRGVRVRSQRPRTNS